MQEGVIDASDYCTQAVEKSPAVISRLDVPGAHKMDSVVPKMLFKFPLPPCAQKVSIDSIYPCIDNVAHSTQNLDSQLSRPLGILGAKQSVDFNLHGKFQPDQFSKLAPIRSERIKNKPTSQQKDESASVNLLDYALLGFGLKEEDRLTLCTTGFYGTTKLKLSTMDYPRMSITEDIFDIDSCFWRGTGRITQVTSFQGLDLRFSIFHFQTSRKG